MKSKEKEAARRLRSLGYSLKEIVAELKVAKSSVSIWVRDIELTFQQKQTLTEKSLKKELIERRRATRLTNENARRQIIIDFAKEQIKIISDRELWLIGVMLYWAEGGKTQRIVRFSNSDPEMIKIMMSFFRKVCKVPEEKFRGYIHIHPHLDFKHSERFWSETTGIPLNQFYKTYRKMNVASKHPRDNIPLGTLDIYITSTELFLKIKGWVEGVFASY